MPYLLTHLLSDSAQLFPEAAALRCRTRTLTYSHLEDWSSRLSGLLRSQGVRRGDRVGILLPKGPAQIVSAFGVLKSGAAYVPLDPFWPIRRACEIASDCSLRAVIGTSSRLQSLASACSSPSMLQIEAPFSDSWPGDAWEAVEDAFPQVCDRLIEEDLAYILYTSGSTGHPKGVAISHRASLSFVEWAGDTFKVDSADRLSNHAPLHFDLSVFDIFASVRAGATMVSVPEEFSSFPLELVRFLEKERISVWYSVPTALIQMLDAGLSTARLDHLTTVLFAGEVFPLKHLRRLRHALPQCRIFNLFGPTETNVCTFHEVGEVPRNEAQGSVIGTPCANTEVWIESETGVPARTGQKGELMVRGPSLMSGYWNRPEETAKVLRRDFHGGIERRSYRTGDWALQGPDGVLTFLGRNDDLIKFRGYRIELGEIESVLLEVETVREAAVIARFRELKEPDIVAFLVVTRPSATGPMLSRYCLERLPRYMLPARFLFLEALPRTSTGKVDRKSLLEHPLLDSARTASQ